jgi:hypothetical protein
MLTRIGFPKKYIVTELFVVKGIQIVRGAKMSDFEIIMFIFIIIATSSSFYIGRKRGIQDAVDYLENEGVLTFDDTNQK